MNKKVGVWLVASLGVALAAFFAGRALHTNAGAGAAFDYGVAAYTAADPIAGLSKGGFSGFGEVQGFEGRTVLGGRIVAIEGTSITVESDAGLRSTVPVTDGALLRTLLPAGREVLRPGATVVVRRGDGDEAEAVLVVSDAR